MNPDKVQARKMVLVSMFALAAIAVYKDRKANDPNGTFRALWGVGVVSMFLSIAADFVPQIAGPFAALTVLGSLTSGGTAWLDSMLGKISPGGPGATVGSGSTGSVRPQTQTTTQSGQHAGSVASKVG